MQFLYLFFFFLLSAISFSQGFNWSSDIEKQFNQIPEMEVTRSIFPSKFSLERYFPIVLDQGPTGMCMAFSLATARTILYSVNNNITNKERIKKDMFSPFFTYKLSMEEGDNNCSKGLNPIETMFFAKKYGMIMAKDVESPNFYPYSEDRMLCSSYPNSMEDMKEDLLTALRFKISTYKRVSDVNQIKQAISSKQPVVFGFYPVPFSFGVSYLNQYFSKVTKSVDFFDSNLITPCYHDYFKNKEKVTCRRESEPGMGHCKSHIPKQEIGHAMVVIGYDDKKYGGSFLVLNSYGESFADNGKIWVRYDDFFQFLTAAIAVHAKEKSSFWEPEHDKNKLSLPNNFEEMSFEKPTESVVLSPKKVLKYKP